MKRIVLWGMLLFPLAGICRQQDGKDSTAGMFDLEPELVMTFLSKDSVDKKEVLRDVGLLNTLLRKDIGEAEMIKQLQAIDREKDSIAFYNFVTTKPAALYREKRIIMQQFVEAHPDSYVSLYELDYNHGMYSADSYAIAYEKLSNRLKNTQAAKKIRDRIVHLKQIALTGMQAPDFIRKNQYGKTVRLSDYRGKLIILDFWGSWCGACRQSHPHLKELYAAYKDRGLEIVAVANENVHGDKTPLDKATANWLAAIKKDGVDWVHVLNDEGSGGLDIVKAFRVTSYPTKFLLDKDGKVLLRIEDGLNVEIDQLIKSRLEK
ncbi:TlpA family protein disulfide reductase [Chitinophaga oryzae]|uniref:TlpA family protein disulfide reductase n=1 Tax=Chitinophaga oryzae TaxID=2725414 RepID=A0AAE6ZFB6_9BACT|nr:TlpA disulfide reductase family protein [Chitinophaga oryzae]QJB31940.1 TlpA family protein disulfide reductase [Chitinophaga oryzae]QJB38419.1 TlpA family protein disulfide reductase [Chitinophaga oryzae]